MARKKQMVAIDLETMPWVEGTMQPTNTIPSVALNFDPAALKASLYDNEVELQTFRGGPRADGRIQLPLVINNDDTELAVAEWLREKMREADAVEAMRLEATRPINQLLKTINGWFKPTKESFAALREAADTVLGAYRLLKDARQREVMAAATLAATNHDVPALTAALQVANQPVAQSTGVSVRSFWKAEVIAPDLLLPGWTLTVPNMAKINEHAKSFTADQVPSPVPGVKFTLETSTTVRR
jgi:hypothetical protein